MQVPIAAAWRMMTIRMCTFAEPVCPNQASLTLGHPWCMHASVAVAWHVVTLVFLPTYSFRPRELMYEWAYVFAHALEYPLAFVVGCGSYV